MDSDDEIQEHLQIIKSISRLSVPSKANVVNNPPPIRDTHYYVKDPPITKFVWTIQNFDDSSHKLSSAVFYAGGYNWQIKLYPKGKNAADKKLSIYLRVHNTMLADNWAVWASLRFTLLKKSQTDTFTKGWSVRNFNAETKGWGYLEFISLDDLSYFLEDDTLILETKVGVYADAHRVIESRLYSGLRNHGLTCCLNALLQTLFHIKFFRRSVDYAWTHDEGGIALAALKSVFDELQINNWSVDTKSLIDSCGWNTNEDLMHWGMQELSMSLFEELGHYMKKVVKHLFEGRHMTRVNCYHVDKTFATEQTFIDLRLNIKGCPNLETALDRYTDAEEVNGYPVMNRDPQDAFKQVLFVKFPPIIQIHLNRAEYIEILDTMVKINDPFEFPLELNLNMDDDKYLDEAADFAITNMYILHSVTMHCGTIDMGHYYTYVRKDNYWLKFDDEIVTKIDLDDGLREQYGSEHTFNGTNIQSPANAIMLVYVKASEQQLLLQNQNEDPPIAESATSEDIILESVFLRV